MYLPSLIVFFFSSVIITHAALPGLDPISGVSNKAIYKAGNLILRSLCATREKNLFTIDYGHGFNLHFETTEAELQAYLPKQFKPFKLRTINTDEQAKFLVSMYVAATDLKGITNGTSIGRADIFTYVIDENNKKGMYFFGAVQQPPPFKGYMLRIYEYISTFFAIDPVDFSLAYEHQVGKEVSVNVNQFILKSDKSEISLPPQDVTKSKKTTFHLDFVLANSQIYRGKFTTKNTNYFNQDFINAEVVVWNPKAALLKETTSFHPLCRDLVGVHSYQGEGGPIRWYFEVA